MRNVYRLDRLGDAPWPGESLGSPANTSVASSCASDGDASGAGREAGVVREVVDELTGSGSVEDDLLDSGVEAVEVEDVAGGGRVTQPLADVSTRSAVGGIAVPFGAAGRWR
ncbi:hypothetical protein OG466_40470 (plasmid) [Streptomyces sp. NBC_01240]|nr:hypothetical protein OG466_40470 [Streptomyces sp. NBC_01240]